MCKTYRIWNPASSLLCWAAIGFSFLAALVEVTGVLIDTNLAGAVVILVFLGTVFFGLWVRNRRMRLVICSRGIEYSGFGFRVRASWQNVERVGYIPWSQSEGLFVRPDISSGRGRSIEVKFIPLTPFAVSWRSSELGYTIRSYAPWLFEPPRTCLK